MMNWTADFPILAADENGNRLVYLDSAATTQHPLQVLNAVVDYYTKENANPHRGVYELAMRATDAHEGARHIVAQFFNAAVFLVQCRFLRRAKVAPLLHLHGNGLIAFTYGAAQHVHNAGKLRRAELPHDTFRNLVIHRGFERQQRFVSGFAVFVDARHRVPQPCALREHTRRMLVNFRRNAAACVLRNAAPRPVPARRMRGADGNGDRARICVALHRADRICSRRHSTVHHDPRHREFRRRKLLRHRIRCLCHFTVSFIGYAFRRFVEALSDFIARVARSFFFLLQSLFDTFCNLAHSIAMLTVSIAFALQNALRFGIIAF